MPIKAINKSQQLVKTIENIMQAIQFDASERTLLSAALLDQVHEHHKAILLLLENDCTGSAAALLRSIFEATIRGVWLLRCATDSDIDRFKRDKLKQPFNTFVTSIEDVLNKHGSVLSHIKKSSWDAMCNYNHAGYLQAVRRITPVDIGPNYSEAEQAEVLRLADFCLTFASAAICDICNQPQATSTFIKMLESDDQPNKGTGE